MPPAEPAPAEPALDAGAVTEIPRSPGAPQATGKVPVRLEALLIDGGQPLGEGLIWRIYREQPDAEARKVKLLATDRAASPLLRLDPGDYVVNAAFGRAHITRRISVRGGGGVTERFVLNAGGLRVTAMVSGQKSLPNTVAYSVYVDEGDQFETRSLMMSGAKPGIVLRLNAGIYEIVSQYGDANATVRANVTVEAGKLTEANVAHAGARVTFKLVRRAGGEAVADAQWNVTGASGETVKESAGALPAHILAPGTYKVTVRSGGLSFERDFAVADGESMQVEVGMN